MEKYKIHANEVFFKKIIDILEEGGKYGFVSAQQIYTKRGDKLTGSAEALSYVMGIVSKEFFKKHFALSVD